MLRCHLKTIAAVRSGKLLEDPTAAISAFLAAGLYPGIDGIKSNECKRCNFQC